MSKPTIRSVLEAHGVRVKRGFMPCPVHSEKTPSCKVHDEWVYCHGCGWNADSIGLIAALQKRPVSDVLKQYGEKKQAWREASEATRDLNPDNMRLKVNQQFDDVNRWFFTELRSLLEHAPDWLLLRTIEYWNEHFVEVQAYIRSGAPIKDQEAAVKGLLTHAREGLGIEATNYKEWTDGQFELRYGKGSSAGSTGSATSTQASGSQ